MRAESERNNLSSQSDITPSLRVGAVPAKTVRAESERNNLSSQSDITPSLRVGAVPAKTVRAESAIARE